MINIVQRKAAAGAVNLVSDFDDIAINGMKNLSATLKALIFGFHEDETSGTAVLQGLRVSIDSNANKISVSSGVAVTKVGVYPFFVNATVVKELTPEEKNGIGEDGKYLVLRPEVKILSTQEQRLVKTPEGTYEEQSVYSEQALQYTIELVDTPQVNDLTFGKIDSNLNYTEDDYYPILRLSRTLDGVTDFLDTATNNANKDSLMLRDENGRAKIAEPSANDDIANKVYVDNCINTEKTARENADSTLQSNIDKEISARQAHEARQDNPHAVTKAQVGLGDVPNVATNNQTPTYTISSKNENLSSGEKLSVAFGKIAKAVSSLISHITDTTIHFTSTERTKLSNIAANANNYSHPTTSGNKHIPSGGSSGQILRWSADGTAAWGADTNTTYSAATQSANGLMSASDKKKLDGIATGANKYSLPTASSSVLGGVKTGNNITNSQGVISITKDNVTKALGYTPPTTNTTYSNATTSTAGLMSADDKNYINILKKYFYKGSEDNYLAAQTNGSKYSFIQWT